MPHVLVPQSRPLRLAHSYSCSLHAPLLLAITSSVRRRTPTDSDALPRVARIVLKLCPCTFQPRACSRAMYHSITASGRELAGSVQSRAPNSVFELAPAVVFGAAAPG